MGFINDSEKKLISEFAYRTDLFDDGYQYFESVIREYQIDGYTIKYEEEEYIRDVYERFILYVVNIYFNPEHKINHKYMKSAEIYLMYRLYNYFESLFRNRPHREINIYAKKDEEGIPTNEFNEMGIVALKVYLASANYFVKQGLLKNSKLDNIKIYFD